MSAFVQRQLDNVRIVGAFLGMMAVILFVDDKLYIDPVCGLDGTGRKFKSTYSSPYFRKKYYFCSAECKAIFDANPEECLE